MNDAKPANGDGLPELPAHDYLWPQAGQDIPMWSANKMRAYGEQCRLATPEQPGSSVQGEATCHPNEIAALRKIFPEATTSALVDGIFAIKWATTPPPAPVAEQGDTDGADRARKLYEPDDYEDAFKGRSQPEARMTEGDKITAQNEAFDIAESMNVEARGVEGTREAFERWVSKRHGYATDRWADSGQYQYDNTRAMWACWQNGFAAAPEPVRVDEVIADLGVLIDACDKLNSLNPTWPVSRDQFIKWRAALAPDGGEGE